MKGVVEAVSALLISGILIGVVGTVYFWGVPLIQKNKDVSVLENTEDFMQELNDRIKLVANAGGREQVQFNTAGLIRFNGEQVNVVIDSEGSIYSAGGEVPLSRNAPSLLKGKWGLDEPEIIKVVSEQIVQNKYRNTYTLKYIRLEIMSGPPALTTADKAFQIKLTGVDSVGGQGSVVIITNKGTDEELVDGKTIISTNVEVSVQ
ncbi:MAG: hypothetical protein HY513_02180 [Candidatus Aenigmarchaeota archaeon]|nr:hypothetical protein [Candidatus Aenigmarchaeota archaeon]